MSDLTPEERKRIYEEEKARLEAGAQIESEQKKKSGKGCGTVVLILVGLLFVAIIVMLIENSSSSRSPTTSTPTQQARTTTAEDENMLKEMLDSKLIEKINPSLNEAWVNPVTWASMKYENKEKLGWFIAQYCGKKKGTGLNWAEIYDVYSGKKLAKYSESWGFKVY